MDVPQSGQRADHQRVVSVCLLVALIAGCASDPVYLAADPPSLSTDDETTTSLRLSVPLAVENEKQAADRQALADELGLAFEQVPTARRDLTDLAIEWTLQNDGDEEATVQLAVIGANEYFAYDPAALVEDDEEELLPLFGGRPIEVPAGAIVTGAFREDELAEAAQDLDAFTRGGVIPELALITRWATPDVLGGEGGELEAIPSAAVALLLDLSISVTASRPVTVVATLRVRDRSGRLRPSAQGALVAASGTTFTR